MGLSNFVALLAIIFMLMVVGGMVGGAVKGGMKLGCLAMLVLLFFVPYLFSVIKSKFEQLVPSSVQQQIDQKLRQRAPGGMAQEAVNRAQSKDQQKTNICLAQLAHARNLGSKMPACAGKSGRALQDCMYSSVFIDADPDVITDADRCISDPQSEMDNLAKGTAQTLACRVVGPINGLITFVNGKTGTKIPTAPGCN